MGAGRSVFDETLDAALAAASTDRERLRLVSQHIRAVGAHLTQARLIRDATTLRLRADGVPMADIATVAGATDSYLARRAIRAGAPRRTDRVRAARPPVRAQDTSPDSPP